MAFLFSLPLKELLRRWQGHRRYGGEHVEHVTNGVAPMESGRIDRWATKDSSRFAARQLAGLSMTFPKVMRVIPEGHEGKAETYKSNLRPKTSAVA